MTGRTLIVGQSGGATAVINATLAGVIEAARASGAFQRVLGMRHGVEGGLTERFVDLSRLDDAMLDALSRTPSSALGTTRRKLTPGDIGQLLGALDRQRCDALVLIGGNDSADSALQLHELARGVGGDLRVVLAPKTVDNDLPETDHCPGYGSAARCFATYVRDVTWDTLAAPDLYPVKFVDVMGRNAGWLAASGALAFDGEQDDLQPLVYLPERSPASLEAILNEVEAMRRKRGWAIAIVPETLRDAEGRYIGGETPFTIDPFGHPYPMPAAVALATAMRERLGVAARFERPGSAIRMGMTLVSEVDRQEAREVGRHAVRAIEAGQSGCMIAMQRSPAVPYRVSFAERPLDRIANRERRLDNRFIAADGRSATPAFQQYAMPLLGPNPFPAYVRLDQ
jgi:ATP-dependent phosphofructokinase / diphosphate-dependent phosphofructokinase